MSKEDLMLTGAYILVAVLWVVVGMIAMPVN